MSKEPAVSVRELELESTELLPSRETLQVASIQWFPHGRGFGFGFGRRHHGFGFGFRHHRRHFPFW